MVRSAVIIADLKSYHSMQDSGMPWLGLDKTREAWEKTANLALERAAGPALVVAVSQ